MLRDTDAACVATALALCIKKGRESSLDQCYKRRQYTQENLVTDLILS
jgi:hypothetical protein